jgi:hypothetical protein
MEKVLTVRGSDSRFRPSWYVFHYFTNSALVTALSLVLIVVLGAMLAYALTEYDFPGSQPRVPISRHDRDPRPCRRPARRWQTCGEARRGVRRLEAPSRGAGSATGRFREAGRPRDASLRLRPSKPGGKSLAEPLIEGSESHTDLLRIPRKRFPTARKWASRTASTRSPSSRSA